MLRHRSAARDADNASAADGGWCAAAASSPDHASLPAAAEAVRGAERRRFPRRSGQCTVSVLPVTGDADAIPNREWAFRAAPLQGTLLDISLGGVAFALDEPMDPGRVLDVEVRHPHRRVTLVRRVSVIARRPHGGDGWKILCRFLERLNFDEISRVSREPSVET